MLCNVDKKFVLSRELVCIERQRQKDISIYLHERLINYNEGSVHIEETHF